MADTSIVYNIFAKFHGDSTKMEKFGRVAGLAAVAVVVVVVEEVVEESATLRFAISALITFPEFCAKQQQIGCDKHQSFSA